MYAPIINTVTYKEFNIEMNSISYLSDFYYTVLYHSFIVGINVTYEAFSYISKINFIMKNLQLNELDNQLYLIID